MVYKNNLAEASLKTLKTSPLKLRKITRAIQGMSVEEANKILTFSNLKVAKIVKDLLKSAMANAENNHGMDIDNLIIYKIDIGKSIDMKRYRFGRRGRVSKYKKHFSNMKIYLVEQTKEVL